MRFSRHLSRMLPFLALAFSGLAALSAAHAQGRFVASADGQEVTDTQALCAWFDLPAPAFFQQTNKQPVLDSVF